MELNGLKANDVYDVKAALLVHDLTHLIVNFETEVLILYLHIHQVQI